MATPTELHQLYLAYFGRPPDPGGLVFYANMTVAEAAARFSASPEALARYGPGFSAATIESIYLNLFNRPAEPAGIAFWTNAVNTGAITAAGAALAILQGAQNDDKVAVANKLAVSVRWVASIDTAAEAIAYSGDAAAGVARSLIAQTGPDAASLAAALAQVDAKLASLVTPAPVADGGSSGGGAPVTSFTLTAGTDNFAGGATDDTFTGTGGTGGTYSAADTLAGGGGTDTLSVTTGSDIAVDGTTVTGMEVIAVTNTGPATNYVMLSNMTGPLTLMNNASTAALEFWSTTLADFSVKDVQTNTALKITDTAALAGNADAVTVTLSGAGNSTSAYKVEVVAHTATTNQFEELTIHSLGTFNSIVLTTDTTQTSLATLKITGSAKLNLMPAADNIRTSATTIDASAAGGGVTIGGYNGNQQLGAADHTVTLGAGDDAVYFGANLTGADKVDGGGGTDTLGSTRAFTAAMLTQVSNFEILHLDAALATITQDASLLPGWSYSVSGAGRTVALNLLANAATTQVTGHLTIFNQTLADGSGGADSLTVSIGKGPTGLTLGTLNNVTGLETLNLVAAGDAGTTHTLTTNAVTAAQVLTGSTHLTITNALATASFDASAFTGNLTVKAHATQATTIKGGSGNDTIQAGLGANVLSTGAGNDVVRFADNTRTGNGGLASYATLAGISDFSVGDDKLAFSAGNTNFGLTTLSGIGTATSGLAKGASAQGLDAGDVMVVQAVAKDAAAAAATANVSFIKLTTGVAFTTDIKGTFTAALGTASVTGLAANGNYLVSAFDTTSSRMLVGVVNVAANVSANTTLAANDFVDADIAVVGVFNLSASDYAAFGAGNLANAF